MGQDRHLRWAVRVIDRDGTISYVVDEAGLGRSGIKPFPRRSIALEIADSLVPLYPHSRISVVRYSMRLNEGEW